MRAPYFLVLCYVVISTAENSANNTKVEIENPNVNDLGNSLIAFLRVSDFGDKNERLDDLRAKLAKIDSFKINNERFAEVLLNETKQTDLNQTNFFDALNEVDHFQKVVDKEKNLYLNLKEKMNRDDVLKVLAEKGDERVMMSARRMMDKDYVPQHTKEMEMDDVVDKLIAESPHDHHNFSRRDRYNKYWDPQKELEELEEHHQHNARRIFKGERTTVRYYPFMVSIHVMGRFWCGGVIYWHDIVLTSAACLQLMHNNRFFRENPRILAVRVGSNHSRIGGELVDALEVFFHPGYNPRTLRNNIAVIRLRRHLKFTTKRIPKIIDIAHNSMGLPSTAEVLVLGWGVTKTSQKMAFEPIFLQRKFLPVYPNIFCKEIYGNKFISQSMFCAGTFTTGEGACDHDAGGPAILGGRLVGIISFGPTVCGYPNVPTAFTLVGAFADWIETINETMPSYYRGKKRTTTTTRFPYSDLFTRPSIAPIQEILVETQDSQMELENQKPLLGSNGSVQDIEILLKSEVPTEVTPSKPKDLLSPIMPKEITNSCENETLTNATYIKLRGQDDNEIKPGAFQGFNVIPSQEIHPVVNRAVNQEQNFKEDGAATKQADSESEVASGTGDAEGIVDAEGKGDAEGTGDAKILGEDDKEDAGDDEGFDLEMK